MVSHGRAMKKGGKNIPGAQDASASRAPVIVASVTCGGSDATVERNVERGWWWWLRVTIYLALFVVDTPADSGFKLRH